MESIGVIEFTSTTQVDVPSDVTELNELQLALIGGGIGDVVGH